MDHLVGEAAAVDHARRPQRVLRRRGQRQRAQVTSGSTEDALVQCEDGTALALGERLELRALQLGALLGREMHQALVGARQRRVVQRPQRRCRAARAAAASAADTAAAAGSAAAARDVQQPRDEAQEPVRRGADVRLEQRRQRPVHRLPVGERRAAKGAAVVAHDERVPRLDGEQRRARRHRAARDEAAAARRGACRERAGRRVAGRRHESGQLLKGGRERRVIA